MKVKTEGRGPSFLSEGDNIAGGEGQDAGDGCAIGKKLRRAAVDGIDGQFAAVAQAPPSAHDGAVDIDQPYQRPSGAVLCTAGSKSWT